MNVSLDGVMQSPGRRVQGHPRWLRPRRLSSSATGRGSRRVAGVHQRTVRHHHSAVQSSHLLRPRRPLAVHARPRSYRSHPSPHPQVHGIAQVAGVLPHPDSTLLTAEATDAVITLQNEGVGDLVILVSVALVLDLATANLVDTCRPDHHPRRLRPRSPSLLFHPRFPRRRVQRDVATVIVLATYHALRG